METIISLCKFIRQVLSTHCPPVLKLTRAAWGARGEGDPQGAVTSFQKMPAGGSQAASPLGLQVFKDKWLARLNRNPGSVSGGAPQAWRLAMCSAGRFGTRIPATGVVEEAGSPQMLSEITGRVCQPCTNLFHCQLSPLGPSSQG